MSEAMKGRFVWYDLMTTDQEAARSFYTKVVGWDTELWEGGGETDYHMWKAGDTSIGGVMDLPAEAREQGAPPHWMAYIAHPDTDAATAKVQELGGKVIAEPWDLPEVGRMAVVADPHGAVFAIFTPAGEMPGEPGPRPGRFSWHELYCDDHEEALAFYSEIFGWEQLDLMDMGPAGTYRVYGQEGEQYGGMMVRPEHLPFACWNYYVQTDDLDGAVERVKEHGGQVSAGPMDVPGGDRVALCSDPQGAAFALHERGSGSMV
jgi:predicted enzyme related to lactoylglutathione lyase